MSARRDAVRPISAARLVGAVTTFLAGQHADVLHAIVRALERTLGDAGPAALAALNARLADAGADWSYNPPDPLARRVHHAIAEVLLPRGSRVVGMEHLAGLDGAPLVIVANHLSYSDANLLEILLHRQGGTALADRLTAMAGPKVYSSLRRRFSSLCFGTIKTPQNAGVSSGEAVMSSRDVARAARQVIDAARQRVEQGDALLVFPEGRRSRTGAVQPMLAGAARYFDAPGTRILPVGIAGTDRMFPVIDDVFRPVDVVITLGAPVDADDLRHRAGGDRRLMMDVVGLSIANQLPAPYRGVYGEYSPEFAAARRLLSGLPPAAGV
jgi:1-acyl-sn-glycerol-3-phosphate acyltransferase